MPALDRYLPEFDVNEVHAVELSLPPAEAIDRVARLPAGSDRLVRLLFWLRGIRGADLPLEQFAQSVLGLDVVEHTATTLIAAGRLRGMPIGIAFEASPRPAGGSQLVTETRVANARLGFRLYWLVVGPFSALIRRRWLHALRAGAAPRR